MVDCASAPAAVTKSVGPGPKIRSDAKSMTKDGDIAACVFAGRFGLKADEQLHLAGGGFLTGRNLRLGSAGIGFWIVLGFAFVHKVQGLSLRLMCLLKSCAT